MDGNSKRKVIITGSTGMVGKGVLLECLDSLDISSVLIVNRKTLDFNHPKLKEILVSDFSELNATDLDGYDTCFFCMGVSAMDMSEEQYRNLTYDLTLDFARKFLEQNPDSVFCYVSGAGTDSREKSRMMWARVKGKTENDLLKMPFKAAYMFRPGYIQPFRNIKSRIKSYKIMHALIKPLYGVLRHFPSVATNTTNIGRAMINTVVRKSDNKILNNKEINLLGEDESI